MVPTPQLVGKGSMSAVRDAVAWKSSGPPYAGASRTTYPRYSFQWWMDIRLGDITFKSPKKNALAFCCCVLPAMIFIILFLPCAIAQLGQHKIALAKNRWSGRVDLERVYYPGRYWIGFWRNFLEFPLTLETIEFSNEKPEDGVDDLRALRCRDSDGKEIFLDVSLQYQLIPERLAQVYRESRLRYEDIIISEVRAEFLKAANQFRARDMWENFTLVRDALLEQCHLVMERRHVHCWDLQVWGSRLNKRLESKVVLTQVTKQRRKREEAALEVARIREKTKVMVAEYKKKQTIINARGSAAVYNVTQFAKAVSQARIISAEAMIIDQVNDTFFKRLQMSGRTKGLVGRQVTVYQWRMFLETVVARNASLTLNTLPNHLGPPTPRPPLPSSFSARSYAGKPQTGMLGDPGRRLAKEQQGRGEDAQRQPQKTTLRTRESRAGAAEPLRELSAATLAEMQALSEPSLHRRLLSAQPLHGPPEGSSLALAEPSRILLSSSGSEAANGAHEL